MRSKINNIHKPIKRILCGYYLFFTAICISNTWLLIKILSSKELDVNLTFLLARAIDSIHLAVTNLLSFKILFSLKRVQIQMKEIYKSIDEILYSLKKQIWIERLVFFFFILLLLFDFVYIAVIIISLINKNDFRRHDGFRIFLISFFALSGIYYMLSVVAVIYFVKMGLKYIKILE